jgi:AcrR family transcriptional regulator
MDTKNAAAPERRSARERLLAAADELFYEGGIHTVGIDRVIERAGVAKASLYDCFGSKEELIRAYLQARQEARKARISARLASHAEPRERLLSVFDSMSDLSAQPNFRGCPFARAMAEARPGGGVESACDEARGWMRELFIGLAKEAGASDPQGLAQQLMLLYDGAALSAQMDGPGAAVAARAAAALMLDNSAQHARKHSAAGKRATTSRRRQTSRP